MAASPNAVAEAFCGTLVSGFAQGPAGLAALGSLYGEASALLFDGSAATALPAIADLYRARVRRRAGAQLRARTRHR